MNNKGQLGFIQVIVFAVLFLLFFTFALAPFVSVGLGASNLTIMGGMGEFILGSLNVWIFLAFLLLVIFSIIWNGGEK